MINKIKTQDIISLIHEFVDLRHGKAVIINYKDKDKELIDNLREFEFITELKEINNNSIDAYTKEISRGEEDKSLFILFNMIDMSFHKILKFAGTLYNLNVKYIMLTKTSKLDTKNTKAFLIFYESYRIFGNVLLLRRLG